MARKGGWCRVSGVPVTSLGMDNQSGAPTTPVVQSLGKGRLERLLVEMAPLHGQPASSIYLRPGDYPGFLEAQGPEGRRWLDRLEPLDKGVLRSDTGIVGLRSGDQGLVVVPPFPLTASGLLFAQLLGGSILVEKVFDWPGVGALVVNSILRQDYSVVQAFIMISALMYVAVNLIVDILYGVVDPRVRIPKIEG